MRSSAKREVAHLELLLHLGPLAANLGGLFECSGALLGGECGRLRHGETIAPRPGPFTPIALFSPGRPPIRRSSARGAPAQVGRIRARSRGARASCSAAPCRGGSRRTARPRRRGRPPGRPAREPELPLRAGTTRNAERLQRGPDHRAHRARSGTSGERVQLGDLGQELSSTDRPAGRDRLLQSRPSGFELRATTITPRPVGRGQAGPAGASAPRPR